VLAALGLLASAQEQMPGGKGRVLDSTTQLPVAGATVTMICKSTRSGRPKEIRNVEVVSDPAGMYEFSSSDVSGCDFALVNVRKPGYVPSGSIHVGLGYENFEKIPKVLYLTTDADIVMLRLTAITRTRIGAFFRVDGTPAYEPEYRVWYEAFLEAKDIAKTDREKQFVHERYCEGLPKLYAALTDKEKADLAESKFSYHDLRGTFKSGKHDYDAEVVAYCASS
jgi:hypothetical protein